MRRFLATSFMLLVVVVSLFAGITKDSASLSITTTLTNDMFAEEHIGFTLSDDRSFIDNPDMSVLPEDILDKNKGIDLKYDPKTQAQPSVTFYIFYKVTGAEGLHLDLNWNNILSNGNPDKEIRYKVNILDGAPWVPDEGWQHWESDINLSTDKIYEANLYQIDLTVITPLNASYVSDKAYTSEFTFTISSK